MAESSEDKHNSFYIARSEALNAYNLVEQGLAIVFARMLGTETRFATLIISKIINTRARNEVVQRVIDDRTKKEFRPFTNSLFTEIADVDSIRNQLVHWRVDVMTGDYTLRPADLMSDSDARLHEADIDELVKKCLFLAETIHFFDGFIQNEVPDQTWRDRFSQPLKYPPERDDLLFRSRRVQPIPPETFQEK